MLRQRPLQTDLRGFTLLELLVAMAIFAFMAASTYIVLSGIITADERLKAHSDRLVAVQSLFQRLQDDLEQTVARPSRDEWGDHEAPFFAENNADMRFTHLGKINPFGLYRLSGGERVRWLFVDGVIYRQAMPALDNVQQEPRKPEPLLAEVSNLQWRYLAKVGDEWQWQESWPTVDAAVGGAKAYLSPLPLAVEMRFDVTGLGTVHRFFRVGASVYE